MATGQYSGMDRSAVIRSMDRKHLRKVSDPYPFEGLIKADHKRFTVTLIQCDSLCLLGTLQLQMLQVKAQTHAHRHTHTPHNSAGSCHKMASPLLYVKHGLVVANTCLGYGSGMERGMERKA